MEVGSKAEMVLLTSLVAACLALYPVSGVGFRGGLQHLLGNFEMAKDTFIEQAGTKWFTPELEAIDNLTLEHITCQCPVLGAWQSGLIVLHEGKPRAVGHSQVHHNLYPTSAKLIEGEPLRVVSHRVDMRGRSLAERQQVLASIAEKFSLSGEEAAELVALSKEEAREATDFFQFTSQINRAYSPEQKVMLIEHMWRVAYADRTIHKYEEHLIRKIADLIYVPHAEFIAAKHRVREEDAEEGRELWRGCPATAVRAVATASDTQRASNLE